MSQQMILPTIFYADPKAQASFGKTGPQPRFLLDTEPFKVLVVGLEAGQQIPLHSESAAMYHFLEGSGTMTVDNTDFDIQPGGTVIALSGAKRGMRAETRLVFLAAKAA
ncbi:MAG: hypothetical protein KDE31_16060 [Caldilineaceae bacterium]|nr:hypothetical protein [Caldilineaceae bacterium]